MELKLDDGLKALIESGKHKGYLTYSQVNEFLPDDAVNPEKLDQLLLVLEEQGIELIDESEAEEREAGPTGNLPEQEQRDELELVFVDEEDSRRIDDPVRMYLTQLGEIPLLRRRRKAVTLVEELSIRTQKVQPLMRKLEQIAERMAELEKKILELQGLKHAREDLATAEKELREMMLITLEDPGTLSKRVEI